MPKQYKIVVACGTAIATSTHVAMKIKEMLSERGKEVNVVQCRVQEIPSYVEGADVIIATAQVPFDLTVPVFDGIPFLTGIGLEEVVNRIDKTLDQKP